MTIVDVRPDNPQESLFVVALPKTASTALMIALGRVNGLPTEQRFLPRAWWAPERVRRLPGLGALVGSWRDRFPAEGFELLARAHSDMCDFGRPGGESAFAATYGDGGARIYKQHFPPTSGNRRLLAGRRVVFLDAPADAVVESYGRVPGDGRTGWRRDLEDPSYRRHLLDELQRFRTGWHEEPAVLRITREELLADPVDALRRISDFWPGSRPPPADFELPRARYYRAPS